MATVESRTLLHFTHTLTTAIALDLLKIASKLVEVEVITVTQLRAAQLQPKDDHLKASELVTHVIDQVSLQPENFAVFLRVLEEAGVPQRVIRDMHMQLRVSNRMCENCTVDNTAYLK